MTTMTLQVPGMTCRHCVRTVTSALRDVPGVEQIEADGTTGTVVLFGAMRQADVLAGLDSSGFPGSVVAAAPAAPAATPARRRRGPRARAEVLGEPRPPGSVPRDRP